MTQQQKVLVRYWLTGALAVVALYLLSGHENYRLFLLLALPVVFVIDKTMKPHRPAGTPTPIEIVERSTRWKFFFVIYMLSAVLLAVVSVWVITVGSWLRSNPWVLFPLVLAPIIGPVVQSEIALYKAYGEVEP